MEGFQRLDVDLAAKLKLLCHENGREKKEHLKETAEIFHEWGLLYKINPSHAGLPGMIKLVQGCALLNAAIVRQPFNEMFKKSLDAFCSHALNLANAKQKDADLVKISEEVAIKINIMRDGASACLRHVEIIPSKLNKDNLEKLERKKCYDIKLIQNKITSEFTKILQYISERCIDVMGDPPCNYAVIAMGSIARKEVTPYSDVEYAILLEDRIELESKEEKEKIMNFFRWFSTIYNIVLVNLKETILKILTIPFLNDVLIDDGDWFFDDFTPSGIRPDGFHPASSKVPTGRVQKTKEKPWTTELIGAVCEIVKFLETERSQKEGYKLKDVLMQTSFVSGSRNVYDQFLQQSRNKLENNQNASSLDRGRPGIPSENQIVYLLVHSISLSEIDVKKVMYRTLTLCLTKISNFFKLGVSSSFDIVDTLQQKGLITKEAAHQLSYAVAVSCEIRLKVYMSAKSQNMLSSNEDPSDYEDDIAVENWSLDSLFGANRQLDKVVGEQSLRDSLIVIIALQDWWFSKEKEIEQLNAKLKRPFTESSQDLLDMVLGQFTSLTKSKNSKVIDVEKFVDIPSASSSSDCATSTEIRPSSTDAAKENETTVSPKEDDAMQKYLREVVYRPAVYALDLYGSNMLWQNLEIPSETKLAIEKYIEYAKKYLGPLLPNQCKGESSSKADQNEAKNIVSPAEIAQLQNKVENQIPEDVFAFFNANAEIIESASQAQSWSEQSISDEDATEFLMKALKRFAQMIKILEESHHFKHSITKMHLGYMYLSYSKGLNVIENYSEALKYANKALKIFIKFNVCSIYTKQARVEVKIAVNGCLSLSKD